MVTGILDETCVVCTDHRQQWRSTLCLSLRSRFLHLKHGDDRFLGLEDFLQETHFLTTRTSKKKLLKEVERVVVCMQQRVKPTKRSKNKSSHPSTSILEQKWWAWSPRRSHFFFLLLRNYGQSCAGQFFPVSCLLLLHPGGRRPLDRLLCHLCGNGCQNATRRALDAWWYTSRNNLCSSVASATLFDRSIEHMDATWCNFLVSSAFHDRPQTTRFQA